MGKSAHVTKDRPFQLTRRQARPRAPQKCLFMCAMDKMPDLKKTKNTNLGFETMNSISDLTLLFPDSVCEVLKTDGSRISQERVLD